MLGSSVFANGGPWLSVGQVNAGTSHPCPQSIRCAVGLSHRHTIATWSRLLSVQLSCVQFFVTPWITTHQASCPLSTPGAYSNSCPSSRWCHPTTSSSVVPFFSCLQSLPASGSFMSWFFSAGAKYWSFIFSISPSSEYSGLISFRIDRFNLLTVQGTLKRLLQHHSSKASVLWHSAFFMVQLSHLYMTTRKNHGFD